MKPLRASRRLLIVTVLASPWTTAACVTSSSNPAPSDAGGGEDATLSDAGDARAPDASFDAGVDTGAPDVSVDAAADAGSEASVDAGTDASDAGAEGGAPIAGLVAYYPFSGNANDVSPSGNNGTVYGATLAPDKNGVPNSAYSFDGSTSYIEAGSTNLPSGASDRTLTFWINPADAGPSCGATGSSVVFFGAGDCNSKMFGGGYCDSSWYFWGGCNDWSPAAGDPAYQGVTPGTWNFIALRLQGTTLTAWLNGISMTQSKTLTTGVGPVWIGAETNTGALPFRSWFKGVVDEVRIYNRALSDAEVDAVRAAY